MTRFDSHSAAIRAQVPDHIVGEARAASVYDLAKLHSTLRPAGLDEFAGPCPVCGGKDRFSVNTSKNIWNCRMCTRGGDAIGLWQHITGDNFVDTIVALTGWTGPAISSVARDYWAQQKSLAARGDDLTKSSALAGGGAAMPPHGAPTHTPHDDGNAFRRRARKDAYRLWRGAAPAGDIIRDYFEVRGIDWPAWRLKAIREVAMLDYWHRPKGAQRGSVIHRGPAMLAAITSMEGKFIGIHRTWLDLGQANGKAEIVCPETGEVLVAKKILGSHAGGAIVLRDGNADATCLTMGEGIETTLAFAEMNGDLAHCALWAGITLGNMAGKAASSVAHPTDRRITTRGVERPVMVGGPAPHADANVTALVPDARFTNIRLLGDGDSDFFATRNAMRRAENRLTALVAGRRVVTGFAPDGQDFNDVLHGQKAADAISDGPKAVAS